MRSVLAIPAAIALPNFISLNHAEDFNPLIQTLFGDRNFADIPYCCADMVNRRLQRCRDILVDSIHTVLCNQQTFDLGGILVLAQHDTADLFENIRTVCEEAQYIHARAIRCLTVRRNAAIGRTDAENAVIRTGNTNRTQTVAAQCKVYQTACRCCTGAGRRSARETAEVVRVKRRTVVPILAADAEAQLVANRLAHQIRAGIQKTENDAGCKLIRPVRFHPHRMAVSHGASQNLKYVFGRKNEPLQRTLSGALHGNMIFAYKCLQRVIRRRIRHGETGIVQQFVRHHKNLFSLSYPKYY